MQSSRVRRAACTAVGLALTTLGGWWATEEHGVAATLLGLLVAAAGFAVAIHAEPLRPPTRLLALCLPTWVVLSPHVLSSLSGASGPGALGEVAGALVLAAPMLLAVTLIDIDRRRHRTSS